MCIPSNGEIVPVDHACPGEIVILADDTLKLNDILGNEKLLPHKTRIDNPMPLLRTTVEPVSYTHLDVYKRQVHNPITFGFGFCPVWV